VNIISDDNHVVHEHVSVSLWRYTQKLLGLQLIAKQQGRHSHDKHDHVKHISNCPSVIW